MPKAEPAEMLAPEEPGLSTRERILNAAEQLFGDHTFDSVSLRDISGRAEVNLGLVHYHFRTKEALFEQVVARRADQLGRERRAGLAALQTGKAVRIEDLMDAFMRPAFELMLNDNEGGRGYVLILSQLGQNNRWLPLVERYFDDTATLFIDELKRCLPQLTDEALLYGFNFAVVNMLNIVSGNRRIDALSRGAIAGDDLGRAYPFALVYACAGLRGLVDAGKNAPRPLEVREPGV